MQKRRLEKEAKRMEEAIGEILRRKRQTLATAESCTGGLVGHLVTNVAGSSEYFEGGIVAYSNRAKVKRLGIKDEIIQKYGAASARVAALMAEKVRGLFNSSYGISVTGVAGPGGGTKRVPVGRVYIGISAMGKTWVSRQDFKGTRLEVKQKSAEAALRLLYKILKRRKSGT